MPESILDHLDWLEAERDIRITRAVALRSGYLQNLKLTCPRWARAKSPTENAEHQQSTAGCLRLQSRQTSESAGAYRESESDSRAQSNRASSRPNLQVVK